MLEELKQELDKKKNSEQGKFLSRYFKTGKGEYGEGDIFLGIKVPMMREISDRYKELDLKDVKELLASEIHEYKLAAFLILVHRYGRNKKEIFDFYMNNLRGINNWDLVDLSAPNIVGDFLFHNPSEIKVLENMAYSKNIWERRIAIVSTYAFIKEGKFDEALKISKILIKDKHDLIHKAAGWMLREVGKRNREVLESFLKENYKNMPRTMLRYAIEKFPESIRKDYLKGRI